MHETSFTQRTVSPPRLPTHRGSRFLGTTLLALAGLFASSPAVAGLFEVSGSLVASNYQDINGVAIPPNQTLSASFTFQYNDSSLTGIGFESLIMLPLDAFSPVTIDGVTHTAADALAQVAFVNGSFSSLVVYVGTGPGTVVGLNQMAIGYSGLIPNAFDYTSANYPSSAFFANTIEGDATRTPIPPSAPVPSTLWLFLGAAGAGILRLRQRRRPASC